MCGIAGALAFAGSRFEVTEPYLVAMRDVMAHRGPDGTGVWVAPDCRAGLAHRRLSIIDLSESANQPMPNEDGSVQVVFNGEIYNHAEIRRELESRGGHRWRTDHSDTEVIVHAFEEWGIECVHRFRGMFAIGIWDGRSRELWLVRDRIGVKPLYWSVHHGRLAFASEIKALLQDPEQPRAVDEEALFHYLSFLTTPAPMTLFAGISKLPNATWMRVREDGSTEQRRYWDPAERAEDLSGVSESEVAERLLEELRTSVRLRKVADVPVGVFLSGGIDSSTNAALFSEGEGGPVKTFSIGYEGEYASYQNELHYARLMAGRVGAEHHELLLTPHDLIDFLPRMVWLQDEPIADPVCVPVYYVSKLARDNGVIVCQVGEGSDELFYGYPWWKTRLDLQRWHDTVPVPRFVKRAMLAGLRAVGKDRGLPYEFLSRSARGERIFWGGAEAFTDTMKHRLLSPRLRKRFAGRTSWEAVEPIWERYRSSAAQPSRLGWMSYMDLSLRLPELLLMRVDKMSMGVSLEGRVPFLDHKFVEFAMGIPERMKVGDGREFKRILKRAVCGLIPDELIDRPKQGFGVPVYEWMFAELGDRARQELTEFCDETDYLDKAEVMRLFESGYQSEAWYLLNLALWWKRFVRDG